MVTDKKGKIFEDRRKKNVEVEQERREKAELKEQGKQKNNNLK